MVHLLTSSQFLELPCNYIYKFVYTRMLFLWRNFSAFITQRTKRTISRESINFLKEVFQNLHTIKVIQVKAKITAFIFPLSMKKSGPLYSPDEQMQVFCLFKIIKPHCGNKGEDFLKNLKFIPSKSLLRQSDNLHFIIPL